MCCVWPGCAPASLDINAAAVYSRSLFVTHLRPEHTQLIPSYNKQPSDTHIMASGRQNQNKLSVELEYHIASNWAHFRRP